MNKGSILKAQKLLDSLENGTISQSYYDMAWVLRSSALTSDEEDELERKILEGQNDEGSWGATLPYLHDQVINTLSVVVSFLERGSHKTSVSRGVQYLKEHIPLLRQESVETIGFELTFPALMKEMQGYKVDLPYKCEAVRHYEGLRGKKLGLLPSGLIYKISTLQHSLEAFPIEKIDFSKVEIFPNGSLGNSPAATAYYIKHIGAHLVPKSVEYIKQFKERGWLVPSIYPFEIFEKAWVLYNFLQAGILDKLDYKKHTDYLWGHWQKFGGASISNDFPIIDSDDTAVVYVVLKETGYPVSAEVFEQFEEDKWFRCFDLERNPSISANIHVLDALQYSSAFPKKEDSVNKIISFLKEKQMPDGSWLDKWHISPYYCTGHAILALRKTEQSLTEAAVNFLLKSQRKDGGWGVSMSTHEETLYVLQALLSLRLNEYNEVIEKGKKYLRNSENGFEELWVDKGLYCPINVIECYNVTEEVF